MSGANCAPLGAYRGTFKAASNAAPSLCACAQVAHAGPDRGRQVLTAEDEEEVSQPDAEELRVEADGRWNKHDEPPIRTKPLTFLLERERERECTATTTCTLVD